MGKKSWVCVDDGFTLDWGWNVVLMLFLNLPTEIPRFVQCISAGNMVVRLCKLNMFVCVSSRSGRLWQVTTSELSPDRCLPRLFLRRVPLLLWKRQRKGKSSSSFFNFLPLVFFPVRCEISSRFFCNSLKYSELLNPPDCCLTLRLCIQWVPEITHHCPKTPFLLVGTQIDLRDDPSTIEKLAKNKQKPITPETAEKLARDLKAVKYVECSALTQVIFIWIYTATHSVYTHMTHTSMARSKKEEERGTCPYSPWPVHAMVDEFCSACQFGSGDCSYWAWWCCLLYSTSSDVHMA